MRLCKHDGAVKAGAGVYNCKAVVHNRMKCDVLFPEDRIHFKKLREGGGESLKNSKNKKQPFERKKSGTSFLPKQIFQQINKESIVR